MKIELHCGAALHASLAAISAERRQGRRKYHDQLYMSVNNYYKVVIIILVCFFFKKLHSQILRFGSNAFPYSLLSSLLLFLPCKFCIVFLFENYENIARIFPSMEICLCIFLPICKNL